MQDYQNSKKIKKISSLRQLLSSYLVSKSLVDIRNERKKELMSFAEEALPRLNSKDKRLIDLFKRFSAVVDYKPVFLELAKKGLEDIDIYNFADDPSVVKSATMDTEHLRTSFSTSFVLLENINLRDHTLRVFENAIIEGEKKGRAIQIAIPVLASLFHDFGKSELIRKKHLGEEQGSKAYKKHAAVSRIYIDEEIRPLFKNSEETIEKLAILVENHHPAVNKMKRNEDIKFIIDADHNARKDEIKLIKEKIKEEGGN